MQRFYCYLFFPPLLHHKDIHLLSRNEYQVASVVLREMGVKEGELVVTRYGIEVPVYMYGNILFQEEGFSVVHHKCVSWFDPCCDLHLHKRVLALSLHMQDNASVLTMSGLKGNKCSSVVRRLILLVLLTNILLVLYCLTNPRQGNNR